MPRHLIAAVLAAAALVAGGCGSSEPKTTEGGAPAITTPLSHDAYENGGADGSGADGYERPESRGGIVAGPDDREPGDSPGADTEFKPPRSGTAGTRDTGQ